MGKETRSRSGKNLPVGRPKRAFDRQRVADLRSQGLSYRQIASRLKLGEGTVRRDSPGLEWLSRPAPKPYRGNSVSQHQSKDLTLAPEGPPNLQGCGGGAVPITESGGTIIMSVLPGIVKPGWRWGVDLNAEAS